jgi:hypothetical protein
MRRISDHVHAEIYFWGEPCAKRYLAEQAQIVQNWIGMVEGCVRRGLSEDESVA